MNKKLFGLHISKCAGTSLLRSFESVFSQNQIYQNTSYFKNYYQNKPEFHDLTNLNEIRLFWGHHLFDEMLKLIKPDFIFTFIREPAARHISNYKYINRLNELQGNQKISFNNYLEYPESSICQFLISRFPALIKNPDSKPYLQAIDILSCFDCVGETDDLNDSAFLMLFCDAAGVKLTNITYDNVAPSNEILYDLASDQDYLYSELKRVFNDDFLLYDSFITASKENLLNPFFDYSSNSYVKDVYFNLETNQSSLVDRLFTPLFHEYLASDIMDDYLKKLNLKNLMNLKFASASSL
jgi:hypothetical protein